MAKKKATAPEPLKTGTKVIAEMTVDGVLNVRIASIVPNNTGGVTTKTEDITDLVPKDVHAHLEDCLTAIRDVAGEDVETMAKVDANMYDIWKQGNTDPKIKQLNFKEKLKGVSDELDLKKKGK